MIGDSVELIAKHTFAHSEDKQQRSRPAGCGRTGILDMPHCSTLFAASVVVMQNVAKVEGNHGKIIDMPENNGMEKPLEHTRLLASCSAYGALPRLREI